MPFATASVRTVGIGGGLKVTFGTWSGVVGDAAGSFTVPGGSVYGAEFRNNDSGEEEKVSFTKSAAGSVTNTSAVTVNYTASVTSGTFMVWHA